MKTSPQRFFLIGCARSGTTLLQSLLAAHPKIISFPESHFFRHLTPYATWRKRLGLARPSIREHLEDIYNNIDQYNGTCVTPGPFTLRMKSYTRAFIQTFDNKAVQSGANCWLEKTPMHLHHIPLIEQYVPNPQFIHLVRDGRDVVASMYQVTHEHPEIWGGERSVEECLSRWTGDIERTRRHVRRPSHHVVRYRDVAINPETTLRRLLSALGLDYKKVIEKKYNEEAKKVTMEHEKWKRKNTGKVIFKGRKKFNNVFNKEQKLQVEKAVGNYNLDSITTIKPKK
jgi:hypothetical protein